jgi:hypothetical protein
MNKQTKTKEAALEAAEKYVKLQLATMKEHGSAPKLSRQDYNALVRKVLEATT